EAALRSAGADVVRAQRDPRDFSLDPGIVDPAADLVVVGNPNNPTGNLAPAAALAGLARPGRVLVVDEAFMDLVPGETESLARLRTLPGVRVWPSAANFLLIRVPDGPAAHRGLLERRIAVRTASTFPGLTPDHLRVAVRTPEDNERLVTALAEVL